MKKLLCWRPHRGGFEESKREMQRFPNMNSLIDWVVKVHYDVVVLGKVESVAVTWYLYDDRLKADCFMLTINEKPYGFVWYEPKFGEEK